MLKQSIIILIALVALLVGLSCERKLDSRDPDAGLPEDGPTVSQLSATINSGTVVLTWSADTGPGGFVRIYRAVGVPDEFSEYDSSPQSSRTLSGLTPNQQYYFYVAAVNSDGLEGPPSDIVGARPSQLAISIEQGREYTNQRLVEIFFAAPEGTANMMLFEADDIDNAGWEAFVNPAPFVLSTGDGIKTVNAHFQFSDGSQTGVAVTDVITLDSYSEISSVTITPSGTVFEPLDEIRFVLDASELGGEAFVSFGGTPVLPLFDDGAGADAVAHDGFYTGTFTVSAGYSLANGLVTGYFTDGAGNEALAMTATTALNIQSPPQAPVLTAVGVSTYEIQLSWAGSDADGVVAFQLYRSTNGNVTTLSDLVGTVGPDAPPIFVDTMLAAGTTYHYRLYAVGGGHMVGSEVSSAATEQNTAPGEVTLTAALTGANEVELAWTASTDDDFRAYHVFYRTSPGVGMGNPQLTVVEDRAVTAHTSYLATGEIRYYRVFVEDRHGLLSGGSNEVSVTAP